jgi:hypothetical protein
MHPMRALILLMETSKRPGELTSNLPDKFFHFTHDQAMVDSIVQNGFDVTMFGYTGKKFNMPDWTRYDPAGVYCQDAAAVASRGYSPWVIFQLSGQPTALASPHSFFQELSEHYGCVGRALTRRLLADGIQVVRNVHEFVVLDPRLIEITDWSGKRTRRTGSRDGIFPVQPDT